ncbi:hypothetical protein KQI38_07490 [Tissierella carlieri]|nr:hypothetical protein [Tissierella carlieri]MBU5311869.1 hypothetical protein [Tissierella carlieri]
MDLTKIKEVKEVTNVTEVNNLIEKDWILLRVVPNQNGMLFVLGRTRD